MGACFSKKKTSSSQSHNDSQPQPSALPFASAVPPLVAEISLSSDTLKAECEPKIYNVAEEEQLGNASQDEERFVKKEIFVIKHRKSHERDRRSPPAPNPPNSAENDSASSASAEGAICNINTAVRTSSCTKEEVDAILIQCGRLSRSNSSGKTPSSSRKYSGSKRSYDFDNENDNDIGVASTDYGSRKKGNDGLCEDDRPRHRQSSRSSSSHGRRRTPSREREQNQQRSGSRERGSSGGGGRRVSRSPGRRSENTQSILGSNAANATNRPGKMVSVPATVSSLVMDKSSNGVEAAKTSANDIKRISVKRNVVEAAVGSRTAASPRSQSPARTNSNAKGCKENQQQPTLSRSSSRKAEHSPYRRNPLSEIDPNSLAYPQSADKNKGQGGVKESVTNVISQKTNAEMNHKVIVQGTDHNNAGNIATVDVYSTAKQQRMVEEVKTQPPKAGADTLKPQSLTRSRSSRRSRDLELNPETLLNPIPSSYTTLLLEDIQNFHQTNKETTPSFSLPPCVSKACSILEAVADLNSTTASSLSEDRKGLSTDESNKNGYNIAVGKKMTETRDPFLESEVVGSDDLMEPSFHKYVTVRRGDGAADMEEQESSGSNSFVGSGQQHWGFSSSSWEPNSVDSTDRWNSRTKSREEDYSGPLGLQRPALAKSGGERKGLTGRRRDSDHQYAGGKIVSGKGIHSIPFAAAAST